MTSTPVIIDCDPGLDDAVALLLAFARPELDVRAVTVVAGNQTLPRVLDNCLRLLSYAGIRNVPVAAGCDAPLVRPLETAAHVHGESGFGDVHLPEAELHPEPIHAVDLMAQVLRDAPRPVTLVPIGPMTNVALLLRKEPGLAGRIREIVFMGGATTHGNTTPSAEFNVYTDPEAARVVLRSGVRLVQVGLDVTLRARMSGAHRARLSALGTRVATLVERFMAYYELRGRSRRGDGTPLHDPLAVARVLRPDLVTTRPYFVDVECTGELTRGRTVVDVGGVTGKPANVEVAVDVQAEAFIELVLEAIATYP
jgi:inosine-uridine nucleoside N-ribohydrolase